MIRSSIQYRGKYILLSKIKSWNLLGLTANVLGYLIQKKEEETR